VTEKQHKNNLEITAGDKASSWRHLPPSHVTGFIHWQYFTLVLGEAGNLFFFGGGASITKDIAK